MKSSRTGLLLPVVALLAVLTMVTVPFAADDSSAAGTESISGTNISYLTKPLEDVSVSAGGETTVYLVLYNGYPEDVYIGITAVCDDENITASVKTDDLPSIGSGENLKIPLTIAAGEYTHQQGYAVYVTVTAMSSTVDNEEGEITIDLNVTSNLTSDKYNKFIGYFPNEFDGILGSVWFTAAVSLLALLAIGYTIMLIAVPLCVRIITKKDDPERKAISRTLYSLCQAIILIWAAGQILRIVGTGEAVIDLVNRIFYLTYAVVGIIVAWHLYKIAVDMIIRHMTDRADTHKEDVQSLRPLFLYIGEIVIAVVALMIIMNFLGFNLAAIITSAGIVSLGITIGAQDVLKQFFAGLVILATRPFKKGDLVRIGTDTTIYRVRRVNVMNTELENWDNTDVNIMPNSMIETSKIQNITGETLITKVYLFMNIAYGQDINKARQLMHEVASSNPHVITDGSYSRPYTRVEELGETNITIKMGMYFDDINTSYTARGNVRQAMIEAFRANGIKFDYNKIVLTEERMTQSEARKNRDAGEEKERNA